MIWFLSGEDLFVGKDGGPQVFGVIPDEGRLAVPVERGRCPDLCHVFPRSCAIPHVVEKEVKVWAESFFVLSFCKLVWFYGWAFGPLCFWLCPLGINSYK